MLCKLNCNFYLHSIPCSSELNEDGLLLRNDCIDDRASIAVPNKQYTVQFRTLHGKVGVTGLLFRFCIDGRNICTFWHKPPQVSIFFKTETTRVLLTLIISTCTSIPACICFVLWLVALDKIASYFASIASLRHPDKNMLAGYQADCTTPWLFLYQL